MDAHVAVPKAPVRTVGLPLRLLGDERLARLIKTGHDGAFTVLYERHHQALYRYCRSLVGTDADAQDALQSALAGALVALRAGRRDAPLRPWLYRIAHNESISLLRRRRPEQELPEEIGTSEHSAAEVAEERARLATLISDLRALPERQRGALVMRELSGLSHEEVALALGISVGAAKQTVLEARRSLMEFTEGRAMGCEDVQRIVSDGDGRALRGRRVRAHLRECSGCAAFTAAIPARRHDLMAISPVLPGAVAAGLLARITGVGAGAGSASGGGTGLVAGLTGKGLTTAMSAKLLATGAAIVATAAVGASGVVGRLAGSSGRTQPSSAHHRAGQSGAAHSRSGQVSAGAGSAHRARHGADHASSSARGNSTAAHAHRHSHASGSGAGHRAGHGKSAAAGQSSAAGRSSSAGHSSGRSAAVSHGANGRTTSASHRSARSGSSKATSHPSHPAKSKSHSTKPKTNQGNTGTTTSSTAPPVLTVTTPNGHAVRPHVPGH